MRLRWWAIGQLIIALISGGCGQADEESDGGVKHDRTVKPADAKKPADADGPGADGVASKSASKIIDQTGGSVSLDGASVTIPPGALSKKQTITIEITGDSPPTGYTLFSSVYRFTPAGLTFLKPISVTLPFKGDAKVATMFMSRPQAVVGYERLGGTAAGTTLTASVSHFSKGFIADGVEYTDPPDKSCVVTRLVEGRSVVPSTMALFFTVDDCQNRAITGLTKSNFVLKEDGSALSVEAAATVLPQPGFQVFASLVLDVSSSTKGNLTELIDGAKSFVKKLMIQKKLPVQISIELFAGEIELRQSVLQIVGKQRDR